MGIVLTADAWGVHQAHMFPYSSPTAMSFIFHPCVDASYQWHSQYSCRCSIGSQVKCLSLFCLCSSHSVRCVVHHICIRGMGYKHKKNARVNYSGVASAHKMMVTL